MGDYYDAELEVLGWPRSAVKLDGEPAHGEYQAESIALAEHGECPCCELLAPMTYPEERIDACEDIAQPVVCGLCEELTEHDRWSRVTECEQLDSAINGLLSSPTYLTWKPYGDGRFGLLFWQESQSGGIDALDYGVTETLRELGFAYYASDEGMYEWPGSFEAWRPGWDGPRSGTATQDGPVLTPGDWQRILGQVRSLEQAARLAGSWFDTRSEALGLGEIERALEPTHG